jgi:hypothetical protein
MRGLFDILGLTENKKEDEHRSVFKETDPESPFPNDTFSALKREINTGAKDLEKVWKDAIELTDHSFITLKVPKPRASQESRWKQYNDLLTIAVKELYNARGINASWRLKQ